MITATEKSFKAKLRAIAKEKNRDPADLWQNITLERFLVRLAKSDYSKHFILKGGILLSKYIEIGRETVDLDFLAQRISNKVSSLKTIFEKIVNIDLSDGFLFRDVKVNQLTHPHMGYPGLEISMIAYFGKSRFKITIDIGFGDIIHPVKHFIPLTTSSKGDLFEHGIKLSCYPKEFILAEKLETLIYRGSLNSRMKDYHDIYSIINSSSLHDPETIIRLVFEHRKTKLSLPISFTQDEIDQIQKFWSVYRKGLRSMYQTFLPEQITSIVATINEWLESNTNLIAKAFS